MFGIIIITRLELLLSRLGVMSGSQSGFDLSSDDEA
jgi:hypothetical protein